MNADELTEKLGWIAPEAPVLVDESEYFRFREHYDRSVANLVEAGLVPPDFPRWSELPAAHRSVIMDFVCEIRGDIEDDYVDARGD